MGPKKIDNNFGNKVRNLRIERRISLRKFAAKVGMSPTYLSKVERGDFAPPAENKVIAIAKALEQDPDEFLALAGRFSSDLKDIIQNKPKVIAGLLRKTKGLSPEEINNLTKRIQ